MISLDKRWLVLFEAESACRVPEYGNTAWNLAHDHAAWSDGHAITNHSAAGDDAIGVNGHEIPNSCTTGNRAMAVDLAPISDLCVVADHRVFLNMGEFTDLYIHRNADMRRDDAAVAHACMAVDARARMHHGGEIDMVDIAQRGGVFETLLRISQRCHERFAWLWCISQRIANDGYISGRGIECVGTAVQKTFDPKQGVVILDVAQNLASEAASSHDQQGAPGVCRLHVGKFLS